VENGGCTVFGCESAPTDEPKISVSVGETPSNQNKLLYVYHDEQQLGPYSIPELQQLVIDRRIGMTDLAWREGMPQWGFVEDVMVARAQFDGVRSFQIATQSPSPMFLYIPVSRLVVMSLATFGMYEIYWIYRNWSFLNRRDNLGIHPFWRAVFAYFFINSLLRTIKNDRVASHIIRCGYSSAGLAAGWILFTLIGTASSRSPDPSVSLLGIFISAPAFLFLVPVQRYINRVNESLPLRPNYCNWTFGQVALLLITIGLFVLSFLGAAR